MPANSNHGVHTNNISQLLRHPVHNLYQWNIQQQCKQVPRVLSLCSAVLPCVCNCHLHILSIAACKGVLEGCGAHITLHWVPRDAPPPIPILSQVQCSSQTFWTLICCNGILCSGGNRVGSSPYAASTVSESHQLCYQTTELQSIQQSESNSRSRNVSI